MTDLSVKWAWRRYQRAGTRWGEWVAEIYGVEVAVRKAGKTFTAHYGPWRLIIGDFNSRYKSRQRAQDIAVEYALKRSAKGDSQ